MLKAFSRATQTHSRTPVGIGKNAFRAVALFKCLPNVKCALHLESEKKMASKKNGKE